MNGIDLGRVPVPVWNAIIIGLTLLCLFLFGRWWNEKVANWGKDAEGYTWLQVVIGTFVTLIGMGVVDEFTDWNAFFNGLLCFAASGIPMIYGDIQRYQDGRKRLNNLQKELKDDAA